MGLREGFVATRGGKMKEWVKERINEWKEDKTRKGRILGLEGPVKEWMNEVRKERRKKTRKEGSNKWMNE